jgi:hypothetical protein
MTIPVVPVGAVVVGVGVVAIASRTVVAAIAIVTAAGDRPHELADEAGVCGAGG